MPRQVILIMTDTQRFDMVGCYGYPDMKTPAIDALAGQGVRFESAYTCQPVCGPARSAMFTGLWPHTNGSWANDMPLGANVRTVGQHVREAGIQAAYIGKWHLDASDYFGTGHAAEGWDPTIWYDMRNYLEELTPEDRKRSRDSRTNRDADLTAEFTFGHRCADRAVKFLESNRGIDFFLTVSFDEPHDPFLCPRPFSEMYRGYDFPKRPNVWDRLKKKPEHQRVWAGNAVDMDRDAVRIRAADFLGCNSFIDSEIGRVIAAIDRCAPDALVIYTSDHGDSLQSHCIGGKGPMVYEEIVRIPMVVRWPERAPAGAVCRQPTSHIDLTPTILEALEIARPKALEGRSSVKTFCDPTHASNDVIFMEFGRYEIDHDGFGGFQPIRAACDGRYKLAINLLTSDEFYDLQIDPYEMENLIDSAAHVGERDRLHDRILRWMNETRDPFRGYYWERRPWRADARAATWDYTGMTRQVENEAGQARLLDYATGLEIDQTTRKK